MIIQINVLSSFYNITIDNRKLIMTRKTKIVEYIDGHYLDGDILKPVCKKVEIMMTGTKRFHNCLYLILGLSKLERALIDWVSEEMDDRNIIRNEKYTRGTFIKFISEIVIDEENKVYQDASVNNAFHGLKEKGLLIPVGKGVYQVNPKYYWNGSDKSRVDEIMLNIQFASAETNFRVMPDGKSYKISKAKK